MHCCKACIGSSSVTAVISSAVLLKAFGNLYKQTCLAGQLGSLPYIPTIYSVSYFFIRLFSSTEGYKYIIVVLILYLCFPCSTIFIFILALVGVFYPYNRWNLFTALVVIYALTSGFAGYTATSFYCQLEGTNWLCASVSYVLLFENHL